MFHKKDFVAGFLETVLLLCFLGMVVILIIDMTQIPIAFLITAGIFAVTLGLSGICYWWNNRG